MLKHMYIAHWAIKICVCDTYLATMVLEASRETWKISMDVCCLQICSSVLNMLIIGLGLRQKFDGHI